MERRVPASAKVSLRRRKAEGENEGGYYGDGARHRRKARNKLLKSPGMKNQWRVTLGTSRAGLRMTSIYIGGGGAVRRENGVGEGSG